MATPETNVIPQSAKIGMIGLAVMGENLALNIERNGYPIAVYNRSPEKVDNFVARTKGKQVVGTKSAQDFVKALERPRKAILLVKAGEAVDKTVELILPYLEPGDIVIDGGNSYFMDTERREKELRAKGINFIGSGVSGGEKGALWGPSLMPGGDRRAYEQIRPIWEATEAYDMMRGILGMSADEMADVFGEWNRSDLESFLIEITAKILRVKDPETKRPLVDLVLDVAGQKGTGKWTSDIALDLGVVCPTIDAAVDTRNLSARKRERVEASAEIKGPQRGGDTGDRKEMIQAIHDALYASKICSYTQGMNLIRAGSEKWNWNINLGEVARIWKGGCIIRAQFLDRIKQAYQRRADLPSLLLDSDFKAWVEQAQPNWRKAVATAIHTGVPVPGMSASIGYFDTYRTAELPLNLTQAQRDFFGSHTYARTDKPDAGMIHTEWEEILAQQ